MTTQRKLCITILNFHAWFHHNAERWYSNTQQAITKLKISTQLIRNETVRMKVDCLN